MGSASHAKYSPSIVESATGQTAHTQPRLVQLQPEPTLQASIRLLPSTSCAACWQHFEQPPLHLTQRLLGGRLSLNADGLNSCCSHVLACCCVHLHLKSRKKPQPEATTHSPQNHNTQAPKPQRTATEATAHNHRSHNTQQWKRKLRCQTWQFPEHASCVLLWCSASPAGTQLAAETPSLCAHTLGLSSRFFSSWAMQSWTLRRGTHRIVHHHTQKAPSPPAMCMPCECGWIT